MEFALIAPVMVLIVFGVLDLGRAYRLDIQLENAAREGAAFAQVYPNDAFCATPKLDVESHVLAEEPGLDAVPGFEIEVSGTNSAGDVVSVDDCGGEQLDRGDRVRVDVSADYEIKTPLVAAVVGSSLRMTRSAEIRVQGIE